MSTKSPRALLTQADYTLLRLSKLLSTPGGIDSTLCTICYTLTLLHSRLSVLLDRRLQSFASTVAKNASEILLPGETVIATIPAPAPFARLMRLTDSSKKLASLISDFRIFVRLWGLLDMYAWGRATWTNPPRDKMLRYLEWARVISNVGFQYLENGAYLAQHGIINMADKKQTQWWLWSSQFWALDTTLNFVRLARLRQLRKQEDKKQIETEGGDEKELKLQRRQAEVQWLKSVIVNAAWQPLTIHWSLEKGAISDPWVGIFGMVAGGIGLRDKWRATA
jgi:hypothetical protein